MAGRSPTWWCALPIGAAAFVGHGCRKFKVCCPGTFRPVLAAAAAAYRAARPTAVNLAWAVERMLNVARLHQGRDVNDVAALLWQEAEQIAREDVAVNKKIGEYGAALIPAQARILTHCNAGALATVGYGTALGVIRSAAAQGKKISVYAGETRPYLQGARLTTWEMVQEQIPVTLIADNMAGFLMQQGKVDLIIVGADRIAANGDVANKIGTYTLAVLAQAHKIPFYVAAPVSTRFSLRTAPHTSKNAVIAINLSGPGLPEGFVLQPFDVTSAAMIRHYYGTGHY